MLYDVWAVVHGAPIYFGRVSWEDLNTRLELAKRMGGTAHFYGADATPEGFPTA